MKRKEFSFTLQSSETKKKQKEQWKSRPFVAENNKSEVVERFPSFDYKENFIKTGADKREAKQEVRNVQVSILKCGQ